MGVLQQIWLYEIIGICYRCVKIPQYRYMEHGLKHITLYVPNHIAPLVMCYYPPLVRYKPLGAPASVKLVYYWSLRCSWSIACSRCSPTTHSFLTHGFNGLDKSRRETFKFWDLVLLILEVWRKHVYHNRHFIPYHVPYIYIISWTSQFLRSICQEFYITLYIRYAWAVINNVL